VPKVVIATTWLPLEARYWLVVCDVVSSGSLAELVRMALRLTP
jgi:hypothetical protein